MAGSYPEMPLATAQPVSGAADMALVDEIVDEVVAEVVDEAADGVVDEAADEVVDEVVDELLIGRIMLDKLENAVELVDELSTATTELMLLLAVTVEEGIIELVGGTIVLEFELDNVELNDEGISLELDTELTEITDKLVTDALLLILELLRTLKDVELTDVLDMGYKALLELILLLNLELRLVLVLSVDAELLAVDESLELDGVAVVPMTLELLGVALSLRLEGMLEPEEDPRLADNPELDGIAVFVDDTELEGADGRKMTVAKISPGETRRLCALN
jgi:hypothetical protein